MDPGMLENTCWLLAPPKIDTNFIAEASDDFLRTGLRRMGDLLEYKEKDSIATFHYYPAKTYDSAVFEKWPHHNFISKFSWHMGTSWNREEETIHISAKESDNAVLQELTCYLPSCRSCTEGLYLHLLPSAVRVEWMNSVGDWIKMLTFEKLKKSEILP
jgi:hypothetical protein